MDRRLQKAERDITKLALNYHFEVADLLDGELVHIRTATTNEETTGSTLKSIFTTAHDIRGIARSFGYDLLGQIASSLADFIDDHKDILGSKAMEIIELHLNSMMLIAKNQIKGDGGEQGKVLLPQLASAVKSANLK